MVALLLWQVSGQVLIGWLGLNLVTLAVYRYDKAIANTDRRRRLPEFTLLALAYAGGAAGALLGMTIRPRHKTSKPAFYLQVWLALAIHLLLWVGYITRPLC
jgi:uncharacterized membrane protein YsdA (DUF1294 family)